MPDGDDSGGVLDDIVDVAGDVAAAVGGELKKFGKSASSQVSGSESSPDAQQPAKSKAPTQFASSDQNSTDNNEIKKFGASILGQITGHDQGTQVAQMAKKDEEFSKRESGIIAAKIKQIYAEYEAKRKTQEMQQEVVKQREEQQVKETIQVKKKETPRADIQKTRAEIKNYGAE